MASTDRFIGIEDEVLVLRKVADLVQRYRDAVMRWRSVQAARNVTSKEVRMAELDIGSAEFELTDALSEWQRKKARSRF